MAVNWDCTNVRDWETLHDDEYQWALTRAFLICSWGYGWFDVLGVGKITEENAGEVWARLSILQGMGIIGMSNHHDGKIEVTEADVIRRIGLLSNYSNLTRAKWISEKLKPLMDSLVESTNKSIEIAKQPA